MIISDLNDVQLIYITLERLWNALREDKYVHASTAYDVQEVLEIFTQ